MWSELYFYNCGTSEDLVELIYSSCVPGRFVYTASVSVYLVMPSGKCYSSRLMRHIVHENFEEMLVDSHILQAVANGGKNVLLLEEHCKMLKAPSRVCSAL